MVKVVTLYRMLVDPCNTDHILFGAAVFCSAVVGTAIFYVTHCVKRQTVIRFVKIPPGGIGITVGQPSVTRQLPGPVASGEKESQVQVQSYVDDPILSTEPDIMTALLLKTQSAPSPSPPEGLQVSKEQQAPQLQEKEQQAPQLQEKEQQAPQLQEKVQQPPQKPLPKKSKKLIVSSMTSSIHSLLTFTPTSTYTILTALQPTYPSLTLTEIDTLLYQMLIRGLVRREGKRLPYQWTLAVPKA